MSALVNTATPIEVGVGVRGVRTPRFPVGRGALVWPLLASFLSAATFFVVRPNVGDLQAALARQSAAASGVGLTYWFQWFGGGATPGNYSVVTPYLSALIGAPLIGVLATIAITPLTRRAAAGTPHVVAATWVATAAAAFNIWSGRIPFSLGCAVALVGLIAVRERRPVPALLGIVGSSLCSPVSGAFLAFVLAAAFLVEREYRRLILLVCSVCAVTLLVVAVVFGNPGPQGYSVGSGLLTAFSALAMLLARPAPTVRVVLWCTALAAPILTVFPNGMGSNFVRLPWICLPAAVVATASAHAWRRVLALVPALALCANATVVDLVRSVQPSASASYYQSLIDQLSGVRGLQNYRLEVVQDSGIHTAAYALIGHAALAGGYETQEQNHLNAVLADPKRLDATSYKVWLDNNAVGYIAFNRTSTTTAPEYKLVSSAGLPYLTEVSSDAKWTLYRVGDSTPIVAAPERLLAATQASLRISVPCACTFAVRVRYSKFLGAAPLTGALAADIRDDGTGWTTVTTHAAGIYVLSGDVTRPLH